MSLPALQGAKRRQRKPKEPRFSCNVVRAARPKNAEEERERFFAGLRDPCGCDRRYEPQFQYDVSQALLDATLKRHAARLHVAVEDRYVPHALCILQATLREHGSHARYLESSGGDVLSEQEARAIVGEYLAQHGAEDDVTVNFNPSLVGQASYEKKGHTLNIRPQGLRRNFIQGTLHHEIGTHYLRSRNDRLQPWGRGPSGRKRYSLEDKNPTEEGLASLHTVLERDGHYLWRPALLYYAAWRAVRLSFHELFDDLAQFLGDSEAERWDYCMRVKRGLLDTSQPGGFLKDQMYLAGAIQILEQRNRINFHTLYLGKLSVTDAHRCKATNIARTDGIRLPVFLKGNEAVARYRDRLDEMVRDNGLSALVDARSDQGSSRARSWSSAPEMRKASPAAKQMGSSRASSAAAAVPAS